MSSRRWYRARIKAASPAPAVLTVDLVRQVVVVPPDREVAFKVDAAKRRALLEGLDEIEMTLECEGAITQFQQDDRARRPWIYSA